MLEGLKLQKKLFQQFGLWEGWKIGGEMREANQLAGQLAMSMLGFPNFSHPEGG